MKIFQLPLLLLALLLSPLICLRMERARASVPDMIKVGPRPLKANEFHVGERIPDISFVDLNGEAGKLSDYKDSEAIVIAMNLVDCPLCGKFAPTLIRLQNEYGPKKVAFLMVNGNPEMTIGDLKEKVKALGLTARYIPDLERTMGKALMAQTSTEVFVLDRTRTLVFRGPISDQYGIGYSLPRPNEEYLAPALEAVLANKIIETPAIEAPGCALGIPVDAGPESGVTYHNRISRLIQYNCQTCHRPGEAAPFSLMNYSDVKGHASMIKYVVERKIMPPWFASPQHGKWENDRSLSERDRNALLNWIKAQKVEGDPADAPLPRSWPTDWVIGKPDAILPIPEAIKVEADGVMPYQYVTIKTDFAEDRWVEAMELRVTHPEVVHHILVFIRKDTEKALMDIGNISGFFAARVPGSSSVIFPKGLGKKLPKGTELIFQIHYTPNGIAVEDRPMLGLKFAPEPFKHEIESDSAYNTKFVIPPGNPNYQVEATYTFERPTRLLALMPHMHLRGKAFRYELISSDGKAQTLLDIPKYDFNWQLRYILNTPIDVELGAVLKVTAWFDNSSDNPANPDPTVSVSWGEQTTSEMMIGYFDSYSLD